MLGAVGVVLNMGNFPAFNPGWKFVPLENEHTGAACLDGSPPAYYIRDNGRKPADRHDWVINFQGGGFCGDIESCGRRARTVLGSSTLMDPHQPKDPSLPTSYTSGDRWQNPDLFNWTAVELPYCDGGSYAGHRAQPIRTSDNRTIYIRGRLNLEAIFDALLATQGLGSARRVLLAGGSAGGLAVYLHADYLRRKVAAAAPSLGRSGFKALGVSGLFLDVPDASGSRRELEANRALFEFQNMSGGVHRGCALEQAALGTPWRCVFGIHNYVHMSTPTMVLQSAYDVENFDNHEAIACPYQEDVESCNSSAVRAANGYARTLVEQLHSSPKGRARAPTDGVLLHSCFSHCLASDEVWWGRVTVRGPRPRPAPTSLRSAIGDWLLERSSRHFYPDPCPLGEAAGERRQCNPSCPPIQTS